MHSRRSGLFIDADKTQQLPSSKETLLKKQNDSLKRIITADGLSEKVCDGNWTQLGNIYKMKMVRKSRK